jgi:hypothetical protein
MSQVVRSLLIAAALLVHASPSFAEQARVPGTVQLPKILVSTFKPVDDPESGGVFAIRMWNGSRVKGLCNQDQRVLIAAVPEHFELHRKSAEALFLFRMGAYLDNTCGKDAEGFQLFVSKLDITETGPDRNKNGLYAQYLDHRWVAVINSARDRQRPTSDAD